MSIARRLARLEQVMDPAVKVVEACPHCGSTDLIRETGDAEWQTLEQWSYRDALAAYRELCHDKARLDWCQPCKRLVPAGVHDPDWRRQFNCGQEGPALRRNVADLQLLRAVAADLTRAMVRGS